MAVSSKAEFPDPKERTPTILIVDDESLLRMVLSDFLQECGFKVLEAGDAASAVLVIENSKSQIDLVFTDVMMPGTMDGFGLAKWIRQNRPGLPVLLTSGNTGKVDAAHELCEDGPFSAKPYDLHIILGHIRQTMAKVKPG